MSKPRKKLTVKQRKFVKHYIESSGNGLQSAKEAYNTSNDNSANQIAVENLQKPTVKNAIDTALKKQGIDEESITSMLVEATEAGMGVKATNSDSIKGIALLMKLKGIAGDSTNTKSITINYNSMTKTELIVEAKKQQALLSGILD